MLIEKPIAFNSVFLERLKRKNKNKLNNKYVGFNRRFYKTIEKLYERLLKKDLIYADIKITENYNEIIKKYGNKIKNKTHLVTATSHMIDLVLFLFGKIKIKNLKTVRNKKNKCISTFAHCSNKKNVSINISIFNENPTNSGITCYFGDGTTWKLSPLEVLSVYNKYNIIPVGKKRVRSYKPNLIKVYKEDSNIFKPGFYNQIKSILKKTPIASTIENNINLLKFCEKLRQ